MEKLEQYLDNKFKKTPPLLSFLLSVSLIIGVTFSVSSIMGCSIFPFVTDSNNPSKAPSSTSASVKTASTTLITEK